MGNFTNISAEILESNFGRITFSYLGELSEVEGIIKLIDLETELCVTQATLTLRPGGSYWIGISPGLALNLRDFRIEFHSDPYQEEILSFNNPNVRYLVNNRKFIPQTNGDPAFQTFVEVELWQIYNRFDIGVEPGDVVVDIGANYGFFSIHAHKLGANRIVAVEPFPPTFNCLSQNVKTLQNIECVEAAISNENGFAEMASTVVYGSNFLVKNADKVGEQETNGTRNLVRTLTFQELIREKNIEKIDFLKVDCEGGEIDLFTNMDQGSFDKLDKIIIEYHSHEGRDILLGILSQAGFSIFFLDMENYCGMIYSRKLK